MNNLNKDFLEYQEAFELKPLGFNEACFAFYQVEYHENSPIMVDDDKQYLISGFRTCRNSEIPNHYISAPTYSQAFRWFREKHNYHVIIDFNQSKNNKWYYGIIQIDHNISISPDVEFETYEEAELAALKELIKTIKDRT
jgi:hypothetical protein